MPVKGEELREQVWKAVLNCDTDPKPKNGKRRKKE